LLLAFPDEQLFKQDKRDIIHYDTRLMLTVTLVSDKYDYDLNKLHCLS